MQGIDSGGKAGFVRKFWCQGYEIYNDIVTSSILNNIIGAKILILLLLLVI